MYFVSLVRYLVCVVMAVGWERAFGALQVVFLSEFDAD